MNKNEPPNTPEEALAHVREAATEGRVTLADDTIVAQLDEQVQVIYRELREIIGLRHAKRPAWIADCMTVGGLVSFLQDDPTDTEQTARHIGALAQSLAIPLDRTMKMVDAAILLQGKTSAKVPG
jgi:hypothetical protein